MLVVDDERMQRRLLSALLGRWGAVPVPCSDGQQAVDQLRLLASLPAELWPAMMTLDVEMPVLDGKGVLRERTAMAQRWERLEAAAKPAGSATTAAGSSAAVAAKPGEAASEPSSASEPRTATAQIRGPQLQRPQPSSGTPRSAPRAVGAAGSSAAAERQGGGGDATSGLQSSPTSTGVGSATEWSQGPTSPGTGAGDGGRPGILKTAAAHLPGAAKRLLRLPIVVVTGNARDVDRRELMELGARAVVSKPVEPAGLLATLCKLLDPSGGRRAKK